MYSQQNLSHDRKPKLFQAATKYTTKIKSKQNKTNKHHHQNNNKTNNNNCCTFQRLVIQIPIICVLVKLRRLLHIKHIKILKFNQLTDQPTRKRTDQPTIRIAHIQQHIQQTYNQPCNSHLKYLNKSLATHVYLIFQMPALEYY